MNLLWLCAYDVVRLGKKLSIYVPYHKNDYMGSYLYINLSNDFIKLLF